MSTKMNKAQLSKGILQMKFMSRTKEKVEKEADAEKGRALYASEITDKMLHESIKYILEPSYVPCENLIEGRVSYGGMNPEIERIIAIETGIDVSKQQREEAAKEAKMATDVPDVEMAKFYSSVINTMNKKYQSKPKRLQQPLPLNIKRSK
ncbi:AGAP010538-PA-like protein [Anopheles sinensis]|uniref:AGAP010538-PA-like protein n=1 Tax=Anopheles sinensis TaxID=74873 RepID=A0A084WAV3_ANOSI|nr:AGAP010538-PA-like protein [Anopheles sinensis]